MTDDRLVVMGKRELVSSAETSRAQGVVLGIVRENGRVLENKNGECESPAWMDLTTPW